MAIVARPGSILPIYIWRHLSFGKPIGTHFEEPIKQYYDLQNLVLQNHVDCWYLICMEFHYLDRFSAIRHYHHQFFNVQSPKHEATTCSASQQKLKHSTLTWITSNLGTKSTYMENYIEHVDINFAIMLSHMSSATKAMAPALSNASSSNNKISDVPYGPTPARQKLPYC